MRSLHVESVFEKVSEKVLFRKHRYERRDELIVVMHAPAVVNLVLLSFVVLLAKVPIKLNNYTKRSKLKFNHDSAIVRVPLPTYKRISFALVDLSNVLERFFQY